MGADINSIDVYIKTFPEGSRKILEKIRHIIRTVAPGAVETISYRIPAFKLNGKYLIYFAGWKNHVSLYPIPKGNADFRRAISQYVAGKGTLKFPLNQSIPYDLISQIVTFSIRASLARSQNKN
jgi:uncharacterized protein YdhG (YjbR/CyaY superfamily)